MKKAVEESELVVQKLVRFEAKEGKELKLQELGPEEREKVNKQIMFLRSLERELEDAKNKLKENK